MPATLFLKGLCPVALVTTRLIRGRMIGGAGRKRLGVTRQPVFGEFAKLLQTLGFLLVHPTLIP
jgi:hypothetical protein